LVMMYLAAFHAAFVGWFGLVWADLGWFGWW